VRPTPRGVPPDVTDRGRSVAQRSAGPWPASQKEGHGSGARFGTWSLGDGADGSGMGPDLFELLVGAGGSSGGGDEETRTPDPLLAKEMLYQLSYVPAPGGEWWAILDSNQRPLPYQGSALTS
jgi:hypothetical protein